MPKYLKWLLIEIVIFAVVLTGAVALVVLVIQPNMPAETAMPKDGVFTLRQLEDGQLEISWPGANRAEYYVFQLYKLPNDGQLAYQNGAGELVFETEVKDGTSLVLPSEAYSGRVLFRVRSAVTYEYKGVRNVRLSDNALETVTCYQQPVIEEVKYTADPDKQTVTIQLQMEQGATCVVSVIDANGQMRQLKTVTGTSVTLSFLEDGDLTMPAFGRELQLYFTTYREEKGVIYYGSGAAQLNIPRSDLVPADIWLESSVAGDLATLTWQEEECDFYEIQYYNPATGVWDVIGIVGSDEERVCELSGLQPDVVWVLRVAAAYEKEQKQADGTVKIELKYRSISNEIGVSRRETPETPEEPDNAVG